MPRRDHTVLVLALALAPLGCHQAQAVNCPPAPSVLVCPEAGAPSFSDVYSTVFVPVCQRCHISGGEESTMPFLTYQQIYGKNAGEVNEIKQQVLSCLMPPPGEPEVLTDDQRQLLLDWIGCGAPNDPPADAGAGD